MSALRAARSSMSDADAHPVAAQLAEGMLLSLLAPLVPKAGPFQLSYSSYHLSRQCPVGSRVFGRDRRSETSRKSSLLPDLTAANFRYFSS